MVNYEYKWIDGTNINLNSSWFAQGEPNHEFYGGKYESCVDICLENDNLKLCDWNCDMKSYFICQKKI